MQKVPCGNIYNIYFHSASRSFRLFRDLVLLLRYRVVVSFVETTCMHLVVLPLHRILSFLVPKLKYLCF